MRLSSVHERRRCPCGAAWGIPALALSLACERASTQPAPPNDPSPVMEPASAAVNAIGPNLPTARAAFPRIPVVTAQDPSAGSGNHNDAGVAKGTQGVTL
ncbi:MAG TPA: hypothetical protein VHM70_03740 [Polyangiaceae bacterium]|nr:hypothetical protein [Polyangiaceae bacterium]